MQHILAFALNIGSDGKLCRKKEKLELVGTKFQQCPELIRVSAGGDVQ